ncbi:hypothetical protein [Nocardia brasiliensis]|uniref:hypothetical protein n=1 Tax=Nocardia brasiliensis TaxID=37326 RepID=UPI0024572B71|nr:hypothetical protein [Nocardia brasiliensis]
MTRMSGGRSAATLALALGCLVAAACGSSDDGAAQPKTSTTSSAAPSTPTEDSGANRGRELSADPTIVGARPTPFTSWTRLADDRIVVNFQTGSPECYGVDVTVRETDSTVTVELRSGTRADAVGRMCTMIAVFASLEVQLKSPLGNRQVLSAV